MNTGKNKINPDKYILDQLVLNQNKWISGGDLARDMRLSRNSVWRSIKKLKKEGYEIESVTGRGYRLSEARDQLSVYEINLNLENPDYYEIELLETVDSTNRILKDRARRGAGSGKVIVANAQTAGRGRLGRDFFSPPNSGVYFSFLLRPDLISNPGSKSPALAAVALAKTIDHIFEEKTEIKWVNDIYLNKKKIAGILSEGEINFETKTVNFIVIGVGINVYQPYQGFPQELANRAGFLVPKSKEESGLRNRIVAEFLNQWEIYCKDQNINDALKIFREKNILSGQTVEIKYKQEELLAEVLDINDNFELIVRKDNGKLLTINQGEATLHKE